MNDKRGSKAELRETQWHNITLHNGIGKRKRFTSDMTIHETLYTLMRKETVDAVYMQQIHNLA